MKIFYITICFLLLYKLSNAQQKYTFENESLNIPDWLTNPNYIAENQEEEQDISIDEKVLDIINGISVVEISKTESMHNYSTSTVYLATFNKSLNIIDISYVSDNSSTDWNWCGEFSFEAIEPNIFKYLYVDLKYRMAESEEEQAENGGMILSGADTTIGYYRINNDGSIFSSDDLESLKEEKVEPDLNFDEEACILKIRELFATINKNSSSYRKENKVLDANTSLTYFYDGSLLTKIIAINKSSNQTDEFYFDDELIFIFCYNKSNKEENRCYFNDNKMFRWLAGKEKQVIAPDSNEFKLNEEKLISLTELYKIK